MVVTGVGRTFSAGIDLWLVDKIGGPHPLLRATGDQVARLTELPASADVKRQLRCLQTGRSR